MPNKPRPENPARPVRIEDELWAKVKAIAGQDGVKPSVVVREAVRRYAEERVHNHPPYRPVCNARRVGEQLRGACLNDDGADADGEGPASLC